MEDEHLIQKVTRWAKMLEKEDKIGHALRRLENVVITLHILSATGVGKTVNSLRKHPLWGDRVSSLVSRWKEIARAETAAAEEKKEDEERQSVECNISDFIQIKHSKSLNKRETNGYVNDEELNVSDSEYIPTPIVPKKKTKSTVTQIEQKSIKGNSNNDNQQIDAFSAQLAAADQISNNVKTKKKLQKFTPESIQNSIRDSLATSIFTQAAPQQKQPQPLFFEAPPSLDINMFKKPKENRRVYAGRKKNGLHLEQKVPKLYDICIRLLINNIEAIEETGDIPFHVLQPILEKANAIQLLRLEEINPKFFREREHKLKHLSKKIRTKTTELAEPQRKALVTAPIAPRHVRKRQIRSGIVICADSVPSAVDLTRARRQIFETGNDADLRQMPSAIRNTTSQLGARSSGSDISSAMSAAKRKPQRGPLMMKTLKMLKKQRR
uniref:TFIIS N-terminal domain-containing protein n=2 Tax=Meloidogyne TaxID=189290 RepID=A0A915M9S3_MELJA